MGRILFKNADLLDINHKSTPGFSLLVDEGRIIALERGDIEADDIEQVIDAKGKTLMPGLIDAHVHLGVPAMNFAELANYPPSYCSIHAATMAPLMLQQGFTTLRDAGGIDYGLPKAIDAGLLDGPRLLFAQNIITKTGGHEIGRAHV